MLSVLAHDNIFFTLLIIALLCAAQMSVVDHESKKTYFTSSLTCFRQTFGLDLTFITILFETQKPINTYLGSMQKR